MEFSPSNALVERLNAHTQLWRQGDIVELGAFVWLAEPQLALTSQSAMIDNKGLSSVVAEIDQMVIVSQTCDIVRDCRQRPFLLLSPVVRLEEPHAGAARRGTSPRFIPVPGLGNNYFANLDTVVTAEKSVLLNLEPKRGLLNELWQRRFGDGVARVFSRFAFPDHLSIALRGLVNRVKSKHDRNSPEGRALRALEEIRVTGSPSWNAQEIHVFISFSPSTREEANDAMSDEEWKRIIGEWLDRAKTHGVIRSVRGAMVPLDELTARDYIDSDPLDLDYLSLPSRNHRG